MTRHSVYVRRGLAAAKRRGIQLGRPPSLTDAQLKHIRRLHSQGKSCGDIASRLNLNKSTVWRAVNKSWRGKPD